MIITRCKAGLRGVSKVPGDKSISHRAVMFGALADGTSTISGFLPGEDCLSTIDCFRRMGVTIEQSGSDVTVHGVGLDGLKAPAGELYVGNSGTTIRLMLGILSGQKFATTVRGDDSIARRPMKRVVEPLRAMGANIDGRENGNYTPLAVQPVEALSGITYNLPVASAQVKSSIILAGLYAKGMTTVVEPTASRDHTEIMLQSFGVQVERNGLAASVTGGSRLTARHIAVPGDISSAAFPMVAALIVPGSDIIIENVGVNPTRTGIIDVLKEMGGDITLDYRQGEGDEPVADIRVRYSKLRGVEIAGAIIPRLIDEIPILAIAGACAEGTTTIKDAAELKVKESNRIAAMVNGLGSMGADISELADGMVINGGKPLTGATIDSLGDHRIAMAFAVAGMVAGGQTVIDNDECVPVSFPGFSEIMGRLGASIV